MSETVNVPRELLEDALASMDYHCEAAVKIRALLAAPQGPEPENLLKAMDAARAAIAQAEPDVSEAVTIPRELLVRFYEKASLAATHVDHDPAFRDLAAALKDLQALLSAPQESVPEIKRWEISADPVHGFRADDEDDGEWVLWSDVVKAISRARVLEAAIREHEKRYEFANLMPTILECEGQKALANERLWAALE